MTYSQWELSHDERKDNMGTPTQRAHLNRLYAMLDDDLSQRTRAAVHKAIRNVKSW